MILIMINQFVTLAKASRLSVILNINHIEIKEPQKVVLLCHAIDECLSF